MIEFSAEELEKYIKISRFVGSLSTLYSESDIPLVHPRFVEKLFCYVTGARDLARADISFDALVSRETGVGIKTFRSETIARAKVEKVAEFTKVASSGFLMGKSKEELAIAIAELRNSRVASDLAEYSMLEEKSIYHCLVRLPGGAFIHEEPYGSIDVSRIRPTDPKGKEIKAFDASARGHVYFRDQNAQYVYSVSKNVLYKRFELEKGSNSKVFEIPIVPNIMATLDESSFGFEIGALAPPDKSIIASIVLPLYSPSISTKTVAEKSGINQWNALGRVRKFGESYISVPARIHREFPGFFPPVDQKFRIRLPNNKVIVAKICQQGGKALMSDPNTDLCEWLFTVLDGSLAVAERRLISRQPYRYSDLVRIGKDSVTLTKLRDQEADYAMESAHLDAYEDQFAETTLPS